MSYERYKDFRLAPDDNGCWTVLDKEYQQTQTFPSKSAAKRWIDKERSETETMESIDEQIEHIVNKAVDLIQHNKSGGIVQSKYFISSDIKSLIAQLRGEDE